MKEKSQNEKLYNNEEKKPTCFVIMPFTTPEGYEPNHFDKVYQQIFKPAIEDAGYLPHRVDEDKSSATIQTKILGQLIDAEMVLCDLSSKNPNVLYELGIRHAFDKPVVLVQEEGQSGIFDVASITTISYRKDRKYDEVLEDQKKITDAIKSTKESKQQYSVMSVIQMTAATPLNTNATADEKNTFLIQALMAQVQHLDQKVTDSISTDNLKKRPEVMCSKKNAQQIEMLERAIRNGYTAIRRMKSVEKYENGNEVRKNAIGVFQMLQNALYECTTDSKIADSVDMQGLLFEANNVMSILENMLSEVEIDVR